MTLTLWEGHAALLLCSQRSDFDRWILRGKLLVPLGQVQLVATSCAEISYSAQILGVLFIAAFFLSIANSLKKYTSHHQSPIKLQVCTLLAFSAVDVIRPDFRLANTSSSHEMITIAMSFR